MNYEVIVVGGGPAGAVAAHTLSQKNIKVLIIEKEKFPRPKICAGGIPKILFSLLPFLKPDIIQKEIDQIEYSFNGADEVRIKQILSLIMIKREEFDYELVKEAVKVGAELIEGEEVINLKSELDKVRVETSKHKFESKYCLIASGAKSRIRAMVSPYKRRPIIGLEQDFPYHLSEREDLKEIARIGFGILPSGYGWAFPKRDVISVGISGDRASGKLLKDRFQIWLKYLGFKEIPDKFPSHPIPIYRKEEVLHFGRVLLVGDAAGLVDPLTGEGIRYAVLSGKMAAEIIAETQDIQELQKFTQIIKTNFYSQFRWAKRLTFLFYHAPKICYEYGVKDIRATEVFSRLFIGELTYKEVWEKCRERLKSLF